MPATGGAHRPRLQTLNRHQASAPLCAARANHVPATCRCHTVQKPVASAPRDLLRLIRSLWQRTSSRAPSREATQYRRGYRSEQALCRRDIFPCALLCARPAEPAF